MIGLTCTGEDRAWNAAFDRLVHLLRRRPSGKREPSMVLVALAYLGQFVDQPGRSARVSTVVRKGWEQLDPSERTWVENYWPELACAELQLRTSGVVAGSELRRWARDHLPWRPFSSQ